MTDMSAVTSLAVVGIVLGSLCVAGLYCDIKAARAARSGSTPPGHLPRSAPGARRPPALTLGSGEGLDPEYWSAKAVDRLLTDLEADRRRDAFGRQLRRTYDEIHAAKADAPRWGKITRPATYQTIDDVFAALGLTCQDDQPRRSTS